MLEFDGEHWTGPEKEDLDICAGKSQKINCKTYIT